MSREEFRLLHYAGEVNYNVTGKFPIQPRVSWSKVNRFFFKFKIAECK